MFGFFNGLLFGNGVISTLIVLALSAVVGLLLGKVEVKGISLGSSGTLFAGLFLAHFGLKGNPEMLHFIKEFGLILFVYALGIDIGPRFLGTLKSSGLKLNMIAVGVVFLGFLIALIVKHFAGISPAQAVGLMSGAVTNTPGLGAAQQILNELGVQNGPSEAGMAYALAYPFGIIGVIIGMIIIRLLFRINVKAENEKYVAKFNEGTKRIESISVQVTNENVYGRNIGFIKQKLQGEMVISRVGRGKDMLVASDDLVIEPGDIIYGAASEVHFSDIELKVGRVSIQKKRSLTGNLAMFHVLFTNRKLAGKTIEQIGIYRRYEANITRIIRSGIEILPTSDTVVEMGDLLRIVGKRDLLDDIKNELGNSVKELTAPNTIPIFLGIVLGVIIGSIPIFIPGLSAPAKLGLAGGPLLIAIFFGHKGRIWRLSTYISPGANMFLREFGILLFLACVGIGSGEGFVHALLNGGLKLMGYGVLITIIPVITAGTIARALKFNYLEIVGALAGSMTDPPALEFANSIYQSNAQSAAYATVYPLTMILRIMLAQILIFI
jgi:putative transport protein